MLMRNTVFTLSDEADEAEVVASVERMAEEVRSLRGPDIASSRSCSFEHFGRDEPLHIPGRGDFVGMRCSIFLEVEGAGHYLPAYAGNLDIMTSAALGAGETGWRSLNFSESIDKVA